MASQLLSVIMRSHLPVLRLCSLRCPELFRFAGGTGRAVAGSAVIASSGHCSLFPHLLELLSARLRYVFVGAVLLVALGLDMMDNLACLELTLSSAPC